MSEKQNLEKGEDEKRWKRFREFKGCNTQAQRTAIDASAPDHFYYLENLQVLGPANAHSVPTFSALTGMDFTSDTIYWQSSVNINDTEYVISLATTGKVFAYKDGDVAPTQINAGGTLLSGANSRFVQWENAAVLFIDSSGYYYWDPGNVFGYGAPLFKKCAASGAGAPAAGDDIAVFSGAVWIVNDRILYTSSPTSRAADPTAIAQWTAAAGLTITNLTDPLLRSDVQRLYSANGYLYYFGTTSIHVIADTKFNVPAAANPFWTFSNFNIHPLIGTTFPYSVITVNRTLMFANRYGIYAMDGTTAYRISEPIDGTWQYVDFSYPAANAITGGAVVLNKILTAAFVIKINADPILGTRYVLAMYSDKKWWFASQNDVDTHVKLICMAMYQEQPTLYAYQGTKLYRLFTATLHADVTIIGPLWAMEDNLLDKQVLRAGVEMNVAVAGGPFTITIDSEAGNVPGSFSGFTTLVFVGSGGAIIWTGGGVITWATSGYLFAWAVASNNGKYVGVTITSSGGTNFELNGINMEYKLRARYVS